MDGQLIGLVAVILGMGIPLGALYTYYRVRKLRSEERLAAIARGATIPVEPELNQAARSRRAGILLVSGAIGYILRSEEHTSELQSRGHLVCRLSSPLFPYTTLFRSWRSFWGWGFLSAPFTPITEFASCGAKSDSPPSRGEPRFPLSPS